MSEFGITSAKPIKEAVSSEPKIEVQGFLELRSVKKEIHFDIDRTRWGIIYGSTRFIEHLGMHLIFDFITIQLRLVTHLT